MIYKLYVISAGTDAYKIGISRFPKKRIKEIQASNHKKLILDAVYYIGSKKEAERVEMIIHTRLKQDGFHLIGEWFKYKPHQIFSAIRKIANKPELELKIIGEDSLPDGAYSHMAHIKYVQK